MVQYICMKLKKEKYPFSFVTVGLLLHLGQFEETKQCLLVEYSTSRTLVCASFISKYSGGLTEILLEQRSLNFIS